jgi:hypothetical protein
VLNGNNGTNGSYFGFERMCFLDTSPVGLMQPVWADLAEYSCRWAFGSSEGFLHWPLCLAGSNSAIDINYSDWIPWLGGFRYHVMVRVVDLTSGMVYDASSSYKYGIAGSYWRQPAREWGAPVYWQNPGNNSLPGLAFHNTNKCYDPPGQSEYVPLYAQRGWQAPWVQ